MSKRRQPHLHINVMRRRMTARDPDKKPLSLKMLCDQYMVYKGPRLAPATQRNYDVLIRNVLKPWAGRIEINDISPEDVEDLYVDLPSDAMRRQVYTLLNALFNYATRFGLMPWNPCVVAERPSVSKSVVYGLEDDDVRRLLEANRTDRIYSLLVTAIATGMRQGELCGLFRECVDLDRNEIRVERQLQEISGVKVIKEPKSDSGHRVIDICQFTSDVLREHLRHVDRIGWTKRPQNPPGNYVFWSPQWRPMSPVNFMRRQWPAALRRAGLPHVGFHALRHTNGTRMHLQGVPVKVAQARLGHASARVTLDTYSHATRPAGREAAEKVSGLLSGLAPATSASADSVHASQQMNCA